MGRRHDLPAGAFILACFRLYLPFASPLSGAMTRYHRVPTSYWMLARDWDDRLTTLGLYLQTCEHRSGEGLYRLPLAYVTADLNWSTGVPAKQMRALVKTGFVRYDERAEVVLLVNALEVQAPTTVKQLDGALSRLKQIPPTPLLIDLLSLAATHANGLHDRMRMELADAFEWLHDSHSNGTANPSAMDSDFHSNSLALTQTHTP